MFATIATLPSPTCDFCTPDYLGMLDATEGHPCDPTQYFVTATDCESYIHAYRDAARAWADVVQSWNAKVSTKHLHPLACRPSDLL